MDPRRLRAALWALLILFAAIGLFDHSLWGPDDSREGGMIADMLRSGQSVITTLNGQPILEKPPLYHWVALFFCRVFGGPTPGLVRLPAALFGLGTVALLALWIRRDHPGPGDPEAAGWGAAFACASAALYFEYARIVLTDLALTFCVTLALWLFWRAYTASRPAPGCYALFLLAAAGGFYAKGLVGPVLVFAAVGLFLLLERRLALLAALGGLFAPLLVIVILPWALALRRFAGDAAVKFFFWDNQFGRFFTFGNRNLPADPYFVHKEPPWYYLTELPQYLAPWTLLVAVALVALYRRGTPFRAPLHRFVRVAIAGMFLFLHVSSAKVATYALPIYPLLFLAVGIWLAELGARERGTRVERLACGATFAVSVLAAAAVPLACIAGWWARPEIFRAPGTGGGLRLFPLALIALAVTALSAAMLVRLARGHGRRLALPLAPALGAVAFAAAWWVAVPVLEQQKTYAPLVQLCREQLGAGRELALYRGDERWLGALTFELGRAVPVVLPRDAAAWLADPRPRALVVPIEESRAVAKAARGPVGALVPRDAGDKSASFRVITNLPDGPR